MSERSGGGEEEKGIDADGEKSAVETEVSE